MIVDEINKAMRDAIEIGRPKSVFIDPKSFEELTKVLEERMKRPLKATVYKFKHNGVEVFVRRVECPDKLVQVGF